MGIFCRLVDSEFQTDGATNLNKRSPFKSFDYVSNYIFKFSKASLLRIGRRVKSDTCKAELNGKRGVLSKRRSANATSDDNGDNEDETRSTSISRGRSAE